jgi:hypothetical protein
VSSRAHLVVLRELRFPKFSRNKLELAALGVSDLSPSNAGAGFGIIPVHLSLPGKTRFPERKTGSFGEWFERAVYFRFSPKY